jgi:hypothetical protein
MKLLTPSTEKGLESSPSEPFHHCKAAAQLTFPFLLLFKDSALEKIKTLKKGVIRRSGILQLGIPSLI